MDRGQLLVAEPRGGLHQHERGVLGPKAAERTVQRPGDLGRSRRPRKLGEEPDRPAPGAEQVDRAVLRHAIQQVRRRLPQLAARPVAVQREVGLLADLVRVAVIPGGAAGDPPDRAEGVPVEVLEGVLTKGDVGRGSLALRRL